jgi:hypothetical protein
MLLERTIRVFRGKTFAHFGLLIAVFGLTLVLTIFDPLGITRWVPKEENIKWVSMDYYSRVDQEERAISDPAVIQKVLAIHQHAIEHPEEAQNGREDIRMHFSYKLKNGQMVQRQYYFDLDTLAAITLQSVLSRPEMVFGNKFTTPAALANELYYAETEFATNNGNYRTQMVNDPGKLDELAESLIADALAGNLCQHYTFTRDQEEFYLHLRGKEFDSGYGYRINNSWSIRFTKLATNTMAWFEENMK